MRSRCALLFAALFTLLATLVPSESASAQATTGSIAGRVADSASAVGIPAARVLIVGTTRAAATGDDGRYVIQGVAAGVVRLRVSRLGYRSTEQSVTVTAGQISTANFSVARAAVQLGEVVSIGYGSARREDVTGSVSSIQSTELLKTVVTTVEQGLQGRMPGVQVTQGDAAPGGGMRVQIRGVNSMNGGSAQPLYVIDGIPFQESGISKGQMGATSEENLSSLTSTNPLAQLAPSEIESIDVLKDASATAIYGSRGANGVVLITTKRGRSSKGNTTLNYSQGVADVSKRIDVLNAFDYATYVNQSSLNIGQTPTYGDALSRAKLTPDSLRTLVGAGTNWQDEIFRSALQRDAQLAFTGGDGAGNNYLLSGSLLDQNGVIRGSEYRRGGLRSNLDRSLFTNRLQISSNLGITQSINNMVRSSTLNNYQAGGVVRNALTFLPYQIPDSTRKDPRQEDPIAPAQVGSNPLRYTDEVKERDQVTRGLGGLKGVIGLEHGFSLDLNVGGNYERRNYSIYFPRTVAEGSGNNGDAVVSGSDFGNILSENLLRYQHTLSRSQTFDFVGGYTYQYDRSNYVSQEVRAFPDDINGANVLGNGTLISPPQTGVYISRLASWLARGNYSLLDRYLLTATVRRDGSSKFASNNKWATFPALAFAWRAINEPFLKDQRLLSDLKFRTSWGKSGNQAIGSYQSQAAVSGQGATMYVNGTLVPAYRVTQLGNDNLRWETTTQTDAGVDLGFMNNRLTATVDVYHKRTSDLLQQIQLPTSTGFSNAWLNSGEVTNKGIELQSAFEVFNSTAPNAFHWTISANASHNVNRLESLGPIQQQFAGRLGAGGNLEVQPFIQKPGLSLGTMWGYATDGLIKTPQDSVAYAKLFGSASYIGDLRIKDVNGDGKIDNNDQVVVGDANPKWIWGLNNNFSWRHFDLSTLFTAVRGNSIINTQRMQWLLLNGQQGNIPYDILAQSWNPTTNPNGTLPMLRNNRGGFGGRFLDVFAEDGSYVRLKNVQLGYQLTNVPAVQNARVYINAINLITWSHYSGFDPEVSAFGGTDRPGVDQGSYPGSRTINVGVSTTF